MRRFILENVIHYRLGVCFYEGTKNLRYRLQFVNKFFRMMQEKVISDRLTPASTTTYKAFTGVLQKRNAV